MSQPLIATPITSIKDARTRKKLDLAGTEYREIQDQIAALETRKREIMENDIRPAFDKLGLTKVSCDGFNITRSTQNRKTIKRERLVELGVDIDVIDQATEVKVIDVIQVVRPQTRNEE